MSLEYYIDLIRIAEVTLLTAIIILFLKNWDRDQNVKIGIMYSVSVAFYLLGSWKVVNQSLWIYFVVLGDMSVPILFWYLSKTLFDDNFKLNKNYVWLYLGILTFNYTIYYLDQISDITYTDQWYAFLIANITQTISLVFVILGIGEAFRNKSMDLLESRIKLRTIFIYVAGFLNVLTLIFTISGQVKGNEVYFNLFQQTAIGVILLAIFYYFVEFKSGFFFEKEKPKLPVAEADPKISESLNRLIREEHIYLQEGLTVRSLSELMDEQEYKVRRYINQHLGFRNFNDFLNSYRIQDACEILLDSEKSELTILEIAYSLGYSSLGPFNKAFKKRTGTTPTVYRKEK